MDKNTMNIEAQEFLAKILSVEPENLSEDQVAFLHARRGYLKSSELAEYGEVIERFANKPTEVRMEDVQIDTVPAIDETPKLSDETVKTDNEPTK